MSEPHRQEPPSGSGSFRSKVRFDPDRPVVATVTSHQDTTVFVVCLDVGQELPEHPAPGPLTLLVIEGRPTITVNGTAATSAVGDVTVMAAATMHSLAAGPTRAVVVGVVANRK